ncbi:MAG: phage tail protein [Methylovirgula sp.]
MSFLRGPSQPVTTPVYTGLQLQSSSGAVPIAIVYGVNKVAPNIIWQSNFQAQYNGGGKGGGGKGGGGGGKGSNAPSSYSCAIVLGICEGPIGSVSAVWDNSTISPLSNVASMSSPAFYNGATPQPVWSYLAASFPSQALSYSGTALIVDYQISLGSSATLDSYAFELQGMVCATGFNGYDADPALVIQDLLTNPQYGVGFPAASIDATTLLGSSGDSSYQTYCKAAGLAISPVLTDQEAANSILARWLQLTNTAAVWSSGLLKFVPYGDASLTGPLYTVGGDGHLVGFGTSLSSQSYSYSDGPQTQVGTFTFDPNLTPVYDLTDDDYVYETNEDPVKVERSDPYAAYNMQILEIYQRTNYYDATPIVAFDQNAIELYGLRIGATVTAHEICDPAIAQTAAQLILQRGLYIRNHYQFKLSWEYCLLEPMDLVTLNDANLGLSNVAVRITEIEEDDQGLLSVTAEEFPGGVASAVAYPVQQQTSSAIATNGSPAPVNPPIVFEPPAALAGAAPEIWIAASGGASGLADPNWGGAYVWVSLDNASYSQIGAIVGPARQGVLSASLPAFAGTNPDTSDTLAVNTAESAGVLATATDLDAQLANTLCIVDSELVSYATATLTAANNYALTYLYRGLYGTPITSHAPGAPYARLDNIVFKYDLPAQYVGKTIYIKLQSFNVFGGGAQELSACTAYAYMPTGVAVDHPVAEAILVSSGTWDFGIVTETVGSDDDFGASPILPVELDLDFGTA